VSRFLLRFTLGDRELARELTAETFRRALRNVQGQDLERTDPDPSSVRPWLFTVARRVAIDHLRATRLRRAPADPAGTGGTAAPADAFDGLLDNHVLQLALRRLGPDDRRMVVELYGRGRSVADTAGMLGVPAAAVASRTHEALRTLRATMDDARSGPSR